MRALASFWATRSAAVTTWPPAAGGGRHEGRGSAPARPRRQHGVRDRAGRGRHDRRLTLDVLGSQVLEQVAAAQPQAGGPAEAGPDRGPGAQALADFLAAEVVDQ